jgi:hypothetical protein
MVMKKAQMKIQQMAFMLMAITIFFVLVGLFVLVIYMSGLKKTATELEEENAMLLATKLANSPEFSCGNAFGGTRINCVDFDKVMMLKQSINDYSDFWGVSNIEIRKIYPSIQKDILCISSTYPDCNVLRMYSDEVIGFESSNFISLCRKISYEGYPYDKCELAKIMVSYEEN